LNREKTSLLQVQKKLEKEINKMSDELMVANEKYLTYFKIGQPIQSQKWLARANALRDCVKTLKECLSYVSQQETDIRS
jgi:hypothetical protein